MFPRLLGLLGALVVGHVLACSSSSRPAGTQTTSAEKYAAGSPELRTVDNAGYVDPGGRTRQVSAGTGAAPVGTNGGAPPPHREEPSGSASAPGTEGAAATPMGPAPAASDPADFAERAARALCDRETYCDHIGAGKQYESGDACMVEKRDRVRSAISSSSCREIRGDRISSCLTAIRGAACGPPATRLDPPAACTAPALCKS
jgi:hypothetical protein